eukprot:jgi/Chrzof1/1320/Cz10g02270.t1
MTQIPGSHPHLSGVWRGNFDLIMQPHRCFCHEGFQQIKCLVLRDATSQLPGPGFGAGALAGAGAGAGAGVGAFAGALAGALADAGAGVGAFAFAFAGAGAGGLVDTFPSGTL